MIQLGLVVRPDAEIDDGLLELLADETGHHFSYYGTGGYGAELLATVYRDEASNLLIETEAIDAGVNAVAISAQTVDEAVEIRQVVGDHLGAWSEQMLRAQIEQDGPESAPGILVALAMSNGSGPLENATVDLINGAKNHEDEDVAEWAALAIRVWGELREPPMVIPDQGERELPSLLQPAESVEDEANWVTAIPGAAAERAIPRPMTWLRANEDGSAVFHHAMAEHFWDYAVAGAIGSDWHEEIAVTKDERTAVHVLQHPSLDADYLVVHGDDVPTVVTRLGEAGEVVVLDGPPPGLDQVGN